MSILTTALRGVALAAALSFSFSSATYAVTVTFTGVVAADAINGLDAVELSKGHKVKGHTRYTHVVAGVPWRFISRGNRDMFAGNPALYMPSSSKDADPGSRL